MFPCHPFYYPNANGNPSNKNRQAISATLRHPSYCRYLYKKQNVELHLLRCWEVGWTTLGAGVHYNASKFLNTSVALPLLICNREILSSNNSRVAGSPHWEFSWFPSVAQRPMTTKYLINAPPPPFINFSLEEKLLFVVIYSTSRQFKYCFYFNKQWHILKFWWPCIVINSYNKSN